MDINGSTPIPSRGRRDFVFSVFAAVSPRHALLGKYPEKEVKGGERELDTEHRDYVAARQRWVGHDKPAEAEAAIGQIEQDLIEILSNEAEIRVKRELNRARKLKVRADESAIRGDEFSKVEEFKAKIAEFKAEEARLHTEFLARQARRAERQSA
ncbi:hypothetical protein EBS80_03230 [bacterium]|nr:hypothetical protein [bacterium]